MSNFIKIPSGGGTPIELTFSDGHTEKVNGKLCTGSKVLDTTTMIPLVFSGVGSTIDYCKGLQAWITTSTKNYTVEDMWWGAVSSGHRGYSVGNVYLPSYLPSLDELKNVRSFRIKVSRDGEWGWERSTNTCLMWIEK